MSSDKPTSQKSVEQAKREERLAKNLRDNLRRRKAATRKAKVKPDDESPQ